ncbi:hypothetical protein MKW98_019587 [Papaver atlanticum]|uniref:Protein transport protein SEC23 n=1 Tax=Papaver atlanticum TaxID=357466 RepID=A0AAD4XA89_9MAGN|nr:hypothetical protein MKW98_019587 [Papaver atlanticum]
MNYNDLPLLSYDPLICNGHRCAAVFNPYAVIDNRVWTCPFYVNNTPEHVATYTTVEYRQQGRKTSKSWDRTNSTSAFSSSASLNCLDVKGNGPGIVFVNTLVGLVTFNSMVGVHDLGFPNCSKVILFHGERELSTDQVQEFLGIRRPKHHIHGTTPDMHEQGFLLPISECESSIANAIKEIDHFRAAISISAGLLEGCIANTGSRIMVFTSGPATMGPGIVVDMDQSKSIRSHTRLCDASIVLDLLACSLDQVGVAELKVAVENSGGFLMLGESFESEQFKKCLGHIFEKDADGNLSMYFDATVEIVMTKDAQICGALGPCVSLKRKTSSVSENEIGQSGTCSLVFELGNEQTIQPKDIFLVQLIIRYRYGNGEIRQRVTTAGRRCVGPCSQKIPAGFDQEAAASVMARLAIHRAEWCSAREVIGWVDNMLNKFATEIGPASSFSLFPQFMYNFRRSQFIDVFNSTPGETAFIRLMLNQEGVAGSLIMIQPTLLQYSLGVPPITLSLDISSISPDVILLLDSYFYVVIHYGSRIAHWKKQGHDKDPNHERFRELLEAPGRVAEQLVTNRFPLPKLVKCDQHSSQARYLLAKLNPSTEGRQVIFTDDVSLQIFIEH